MSTRFYLTKRSNGFYYIGWYEGERRKWKSTKATRKSDAQNYLKNFLPTSDVRSGKNQPLTVTHLLDLYSNHKPIRSSTRLSYSIAIKRFEHYCGEKQVQEYTVQDVEEWKVACIRDGGSAGNVNINFRSLKALFNYAHRILRATKENIFMRTFPLKQVKKHPEYFSKEDLNKLLETIRPTNPNLYSIVFVGSLTGLRLSELLNLAWSQVDLENQVLQVSNSDTFETKSGKGRVVPLHSKVVEVLREKKPVGRYVFNNPDGNRYDRNYISRLFKRYVRKAELSEGLHFHSLRHTCASYLVNSGVNIYDVQKILGHSSIGTTQLYSHLAPSTLVESVNKILF